MLRVTIELLPLGSEEHKRHLGTAEIWNDATTGSRETGNYKYRLSKWGNPQSTWKSGEVHSFSRLSRGPWDLLFMVLAHAVGGRMSKSFPANKGMKPDADPASVVDMFSDGQ